MKKKNIVALVFISCFFSCKKSGESFCWKCTLFPPNSTKTGINTSAKTTSDICGKTQAEIDQYQKDNTKTKQVYNGNNYQTNLIQSMQCSKN